VREALDRGPDHVLSRVVQDEVDREVVPRAAATVEAMTRVDALLRGIAADVTDDAWSPAPADRGLIDTGAQSTILVDAGSPPRLVHD
jgi:hypothetical protein